MSKDLEQKEFSEAEFEKFSEKNICKNIGQSLASVAEMEIADSMSKDKLDNENTDAKAVTGINSENIKELQESTVNHIQSRDKPSPVERVGGKMFFDKPFVKDQVKKIPNSVRLKEKVVTVLDLSNPKELEEFNRLLNLYAQDLSSISNLNYQLKTFENTWKALVFYDVFEFQNPLL